MIDPVGIERLLLRLSPGGAGVAVRVADASLLDQLTEDERAVVRLARPIRRAEFAAGRWCAHSALASIGADCRSIGCDERGQPVWPRGVAGSISHAAGLAAAVAARATSSVAALGIDVELAEGLDQDLWAQVLQPAERARCGLADDPVLAATMIFSAKEAAFKAFYPAFGVEIDFLAANVDLSGGGGTVAATDLDASAAVRTGRVGPLVVSVAIVTTCA